MSAAARASLDQEQIADLLLDLVEADPVNRGNLLRKLHDTSPTVALEVERLLASHLAAGEFLEKQLSLPAEEAEVRALQSGDILSDRFLVEQFLGSGGFGEVYLALDQDLHRRVALKTVKSDSATIPELIEQLKQEIQIAQVASHPNLCRLYDLERGIRGGTEIVFITMEWISGPTLSARLGQGNVVALEALDIATQVLCGLGELHARHIIHRDLKSSNIMLAPEEDGRFRAIITDFGLARLKSPGSGDTMSAIKSGWAIGTPAYMAPEQLRGKPASIASDLHAIGVILFELVTGRLPFEGDSPLDIALARLENEAPKVRRINRNVTRSWEDAIAACLEADPARRPRSAAEVLSLLTGQSTRLNRRALLRGGIALAAAFGGVTVYNSWKPKPPTGIVLSSAAQRGMQLGEMFLRDKNKQSLLSAVEEYTKVTKSHPRHAPAWAGLAEAYSSLQGFGHMDTRESLAKATAAGKTAIDLDPGNARSATIYARSLSINVHRWLEAEPYFRQALKGNPDDVRIFHWYASHLGRLGRFDDAIGLLERGAQRFPDNQILNQQLATEYFRALRFQEFETYSRELVRLFIDKPITRVTLARALEWTRKFDEAEQELAQADRLGWEKQALPQRVTLAAARGQLPLAIQLAETTKRQWLAREIETMQMAVVYKVTRRFDDAMVTLNTGFDREDSSVLYAPTNPYFTDVSSLPAFVQFKRRLGLTA